MRRRIFVFYLVLVTVVSVIVAMSSYRKASEIYMDEVSESLSRDSRFILHILSSEKWLETGLINDAHIEALSRVTGSENGIWRITVIRQDGVVLADTLTPSSKMGNHADRPEILGAIENGFGTRIRHSETTGSTYLYYARHSEELGIVVRLAAPLTAINAIRNSILVNALISIVIGIVLSAILARFLSGYVIKPIARLAAAYGDAGREPLSKDHAPDEVGVLNQTLSKMTGRIESAILELRERNARLDTLIQSMEDGLIAVDPQMSVIIINPVFRKLFEISDTADAIGKPLIQVLRHIRLHEMMEASIKTNTAVSAEDRVYHGGKKIYHIAVSPIKSSQEQNGNLGALAYIQDITTVRKLEEVRSEFVSNVTHELKTPLTSIRGFVETLKNGALEDPKVAGKFLDIIDIEADRLSRLISDILELSEIETMKQDKNAGSFVLKPLVDEIASMLEPVARARGITLVNDVDPSLTITASRDRIKQLLVNLADNAVKYNRDNGRVEIQAKIVGNAAEILVRDTGIGIPEEHRTRIFERFYRVDRGRSRQLGGTGLGLSIVKHIASLYGGNVRVTANEEKGSDFIVTLPL